MQLSNKEWWAKNKLFVLGQTVTLSGICLLVWIILRTGIDLNLSFYAICGCGCGIFIAGGIALVEIWSNSNLTKTHDAELSKLRGELTAYKLFLQKFKKCATDGCNDTNVKIYQAGFAKDCGLIVCLCEKHSVGYELFGVNQNIQTKDQC